MINYEVDVIPCIGKFFYFYTMAAIQIKDTDTGNILQKCALALILRCNIDIALEIACYWASQLEMD